eukprot:14166885-Alexandrium_andersonii.AAC.1
MRRANAARRPTRPPQGDRQGGSQPSPALWIASEIGDASDAPPALGGKPARISVVRARHQPPVDRQAESQQ